MKSKDMERLWQDLEKERGKLVGLQIQKDEADRRVNEINRILSAKTEGDTNPVTEGALKLIAGEEVKAIEYSPLDDERANLYRKLTIIREAIRLQQNEIGQAENRYSIQAGKDLAPEYKKLVQDMVRGVVTLSKAVTAESRFRDQLSKSGIGFGVAFGNGMAFTKVGHLDDDNSRVSYYLRDVVREGWLTEEEIRKMVGE
ncbi:hypothetical protein KOM00_01975 [Geomonas sp. Red69]|uniref:hypothetical protein n=1 Tax=Geomonas diazotrophica TaxID=2843197 RepID=UPI001C107FCA|nr:hypothetical protein [Geomonas diazotrophica]MBU5635494.1 hypothetical protein [Geomonas diazotrophica]